MEYIIILVIFISNTNTKIILRSLNQYDLELFSNISGTEKSYEYTHQVESSQNNQVTGLGSMRVGNKYKVDIEKLRGLKTGYGFIYRVNNNRVESIKILY